MDAINGRRRWPASKRLTFTCSWIHELFGFGAQRLKVIQQKIKFYAGCIREGEPGIEEFMKCMAVECGQVYPGLIACEEKYGEVKIYG